MSTRAVNTALVTGFFAVLGTVITLLYQELSGHNANRREDSRRCYEVAAELMAAAHKVILTLPIADGSSDGAMTAGEASKSVATDDAFYQFDSAYARLVLSVPELKKSLMQIREQVISARDAGSRDREAASKIRGLLDTFLVEAAQEIKFPVFGFFGPSSDGCHELLERIALEVHPAPVLTR